MTRGKKSVLFLKISCTMAKRPTLFFAIFSKASRVLSRVHSDDFSSSLYLSLNSSQLPFLIARQPCRIILGATSHIRISFDLLQNLSEGRFLLPLTLHPFSLEASSRIFLTSALLRVKYSHIPRTNYSFPITFQILPRCALFSTTPLHSHNSSRGLPCCTN